MSHTSFLYSQLLGLLQLCNAKERLNSAEGYQLPIRFITFQIWFTVSPEYCILTRKIVHAFASEAKRVSIVVVTWRKSIYENNL